MPKAANKDVTKQLATISKELEADQKRWKITKTGIEREITHLTAKASDLEDKTTASEAELAVIRKDIEAERLRLDSLKTRNSNLERDNHALEDNIEHGRQEVEKLAQQLQSREASLDSELAEYELQRKQEIKERLLVANQELLDVTKQVTEAKVTHAELAESLRGLQEVYRQEQQELQDSSKATNAALATNQQAVEASEARIAQLEDQIRDLLYKRDNAQALLDKAKTEHEKFITYEREARKILDAKDKQLQTRSQEISNQGQFIKNQRSFLPEL